MKTRYFLSATVLAVSIAPPAIAQAVQFNIRAQPLRSALLDYGIQSGRRISWSDSPAFDRRISAITGRLDSNEVLRRLLSGTGLAARTHGTVVLISQNQVPPPRALAAPNHAPPDPP